jgi:hypothetical protein
VPSSQLPPDGLFLRNHIPLAQGVAEWPLTLPIRPTDTILLSLLKNALRMLFSCSRRRKFSQELLRTHQVYHHYRQVTACVTYWKSPVFVFLGLDGYGYRGMLSHALAQYNIIRGSVLPSYTPSSFYSFPSYRSTSGLYLHALRSSGALTTGGMLLIIRDLAAEPSGALARVVLT